MSFWTLGVGNPYYDSTKVVTPAQALKTELEKKGFLLTVTEVCLNATCTEKDYSLARDAARDADLVILCLGENGLDCGESRCVSTLELRKEQEKIVKYLPSGKPTVMVLFNSRPMDFKLAAEKVQSIVVAWQPGYEAGNALADVLTGKVNPSGKLPMTFPRSVGQVPIHYNHLNTGRPQQNFGQMWTSGYLDQPSTPAYPFGFGLSYTKFSYSKISMSKSAYKRGETVDVTVTVTNTGDVAGEEVVQLYIRDMSADISRPVKELKGFQKIRLDKGQSKIVSFRLSEKDLSYWNRDLKFKADSGTFKVFVGGNSRDVQEMSFELQ